MSPSRLYPSALPSAALLIFLTAPTRTGIVGINLDILPLNRSLGKGIILVGARHLGSRSRSTFICACPYTISIIARTQNPIRTTKSIFMFCLPRLVFPIFLPTFPLYWCLRSVFPCNLFLTFTYSHGLCSKCKVLGQTVTSTFTLPHFSQFSYHMCLELKKSSVNLNMLWYIIIETTLKYAKQFIYERIRRCR